MRYFFLLLFIFILNPKDSYSVELNEIDLAGIKYGDNLTIYADENLIKESIVDYPYKDNKYSTARFSLDGSGYDYVEVSFKSNDESYRIVELTGYQLINNIDQCETIKKQVESQYSSILSNIKPEIDKRDHPYDKTGKSKMSGTSYTFKGSEKGIVQLVCNDWSEELEKTYGDHFAFSVLNLEFIRWKEKQYK